MAGKKLLVADDSLTIQKVIRLALSNEGYDIQAVSDGNDALQQISVFRPDIVLIDVSLPGKSAFEVKRAVNTHDDLQNVKFVLMSSAFEKMDEAQATEVNFHGRLTKPFDPAHLRQVLSEVLASKPEVAAAAPTVRLAAPAAVTPIAPVHVPPPLPEITVEIPAPGSASAASNEDWQSEWNEPLAPPPLPEIPEHNSNQSDSDIKNLTESTIKMSGLDDFEWSVKEPSLKPPANLLDSGDSSFQIQSPSVPAFPEPSNLDTIRLDTSDMPTWDSPEMPPSPPAPPVAEKTKEILAPEPVIPTVKLGDPEPTPRNASSFDAKEMEEMIRKQVEVSLERLAQKILPDVAERVIKQEIRRLLSEQP